MGSDVTGTGAAGRAGGRAGGSAAAGGAAPGSALPDGEFPALVIDVEEGLDDTGTAVVHLELTILTGEHKGDVVAVSAQGITGSFIELIGMPATITVTDGEPRVAIDD